MLRVVVLPRLRGVTCATHRVFKDSTHSFFGALGWRTDVVVALGL